MVFCISLGIFLTMAATVLCVLGNISQLTNNVVSRNIRMVQLDASQVGSQFLATDQGALEGTAAGVKANYQWGLYNYCGGAGTSGARSCVDTEVGFRWEPLQVVQADATDETRPQITQAIGTGKITDSEYLGKFTHAANYLLLVGTVLTGLAFLTGFLAHRFAFAFAALLALLGAILVGVGAAIWTAVVYKAKHSVPADLPASVLYGNALWMFWGAFVGDALAIVPFIISCCVGRNKY